jgi:hypothetical protein
MAVYDTQYLNYQIYFNRFVEHYSAVISFLWNLKVFFWYETIYIRMI